MASEFGKWSSGTCISATQKHYLINLFANIGTLNELLIFSILFLKERGSVEYKRSCNFLGTTICCKREKTVFA